MASESGVVRIGIVGVGYWGPNLLRNFLQVSGGRVEMVIDRDESRLDYVRENYPALRITDRFEDGLEPGVLDAVVIATGLESHHSLARAALEAGLHVMVEKPLAATSAECAELIEKARVGNRVLMVGHTFVYNAAVLQVKRYLDEGYLGEVYYVSSQRLNLGRIRTNIDVVWNLAPHDISILDTWFGSSPISVSARGLCFIQAEAGLADVAYLLLEYEGGKWAHVHLSWLDPSKVRRMTVVGSERMLVYDDVSSVEKIRIFDKGYTRKFESYDDFGKFQLIQRAGDVHIPKIDFEEPLKIECAHFVECIREGSRPRTDGEAGHRVVRVMEAASRSMASGGERVEIDRSD